MLHHAALLRIMYRYKRRARRYKAITVVVDNHWRTITLTLPSPLLVIGFVVQRRRWKRSADLMAANGASVISAFGEAVFMIWWGCHGGHDG